jgi:hypothetical protein
LTDIEKAKARISFFKSQLDELDTRKKNQGTLKRYEWWQLEYLQTPYLALASDKYLDERFFDHYHNTLRLNSEGLIGPREDFGDSSGLIGPLVSHLMLEYGARGKSFPNMAGSEGRDLDKYFAKGKPTGVRLFKGLPETLNNVIVKFGKRHYLESALRLGELRLTPANFYQSGSLMKAMQDFETERWFHDPKFDAALAGKTYVKVQGKELKLEDGFLKFSISCPNYLLWSACKDIDRRLPDDFAADAALIIRKPQAFVSRLTKHVNKMFPSMSSWSGDVKYYDPCSFVDMKLRPETIKHFSFLYQREWRFCAFPEQIDMPKEPLMITLGALDDIADLITL